MLAVVPACASSAPSSATVSATADATASPFPLPHVRESVEVTSYSGGVRAYRVGGDRRSGCVWLEAVSSGQRYNALWPEGWSAQFDPLRIYDKRRRLNWLESDVRSLPLPGRVKDKTQVPANCKAIGQTVLLEELDLAPPE
jgi:hypothetical protein